MWARSGSSAAAGAASAGLSKREGSTGAPRPGSIAGDAVPAEATAPEPGEASSSLSPALTDPFLNFVGLAGSPFTMDCMTASPSKASFAYSTRTGQTGRQSSSTYRRESAAPPRITGV
jgi:hypothetical protein